MFKDRPAARDGGEINARLFHGLCPGDEGGTVKPELCNDAHVGVHLITEHNLFLKDAHDVTRAIGRIAFRVATNGNLRDERQEVVRDAARVFTDLACRVSPDGIEVAQ